MVYVKQAVKRLLLMLKIAITCVSTKMRPLLRQVDTNQWIVWTGGLMGGMRGFQLAKFPTAQDL